MKYKHNLPQNVKTVEYITVIFDVFHFILEMITHYTHTHIL